MRRSTVKSTVKSTVMPAVMSAVKSAVRPGCGGEKKGRCFSSGRGRTYADFQWRRMDMAIGKGGRAPGVAIQ